MRAHFLAGVFFLVSFHHCLAASTPASRVFDIRNYGAAGDGTNSETSAINRAIADASDAGGGQVLFPPGRHLSGTIHLRSRVALFFEAGATLVGTTNLSEYEQPVVPSFMPEAKWGKWHRALVVGENVDDVAIGGPGVIDGNKVFDPTGEERMRGPHTIVFVNCHRLTIRDLSIVDSANYAIFFQISDQVDIRNVKITGGWDGVHFRGAPGRPCRDVNIVDCQFYTGDDAIAGRYWENTVIAGCILNSSCNGLRLIGPATHLIVNDCLFYGPGTQPHRSSGARRRTNMLAGITLQPGGWDKTEGAVEDVVISRTTMHHVAAPVSLTMKQGNTVGRVTINGLTATGVYRAALSVESWADAPITNVVIRNAQIEFEGGGTEAQSKQKMKAPGVDVRPLPSWGVYAHHVEQLTIDDVRLSLAQDDFRPVLLAEDVQRLNLDNFKFTRVDAVGDPIQLANVGKTNIVANGELRLK